MMILFLYLSLILSNGVKDISEQLQEVEQTAVEVLVSMAKEALIQELSLTRTREIFKSSSQSNSMSDAALNENDVDWDLLDCQCLVCVYVFLWFLCILVNFRGAIC